MRIQEIIEIQQDITNVLENSYDVTPITTRGVYVLSVVNKLKRRVFWRKKKDQIAGIIVKMAFALSIILLIAAAIM